MCLELLDDELHPLIHVQPRTLEIFNVLGLMPEIATKGETMPGIRYYKMPGSQYVSTMTFTKVEEATPQNPFVRIYRSSPTWTLHDVATDS